MAQKECLVLLMVVVIPITLLSCCLANPQLRPHFYDSSCPPLESIIRSAVQQAMQHEARIAASLLRLFFHDCFVNGCDASILLDDTASFTGEKTGLSNDHSLRGYEVVDSIKSQVEDACSNTVSCADILAIAARDSVALSGGPYWTVPLGRRDSTTASLNLSNDNLPSPRATNPQLIASFQKVGLSIEDMVALSGAHSIGRARCARFIIRLYDFNGTGQSDPRINPGYLRTLEQTCPSGGDEEVTSPLDHVTPDSFDNQYYKNLLNGEGLLNSDEELNNNLISRLVYTFSTDQDAFFNHFAESMVNMGNLDPLTGTQGQIRRNCRRVN